MLTLPLKTLLILTPKKTKRRRYERKNDVTFTDVEFTMLNYAKSLHVIYWYLQMRFGVFDP